MVAKPEKHFFGTSLRGCAVLLRYIYDETIALFAFLLLLLTACSAKSNQTDTALPNNSTQTLEEQTLCNTNTYELHITTSLLCNNSVGNDWVKAYTSEGAPIADGKQWTVPCNTTKTVTIDITITEKDKIEDVGTGSISVALFDGSEVSTVITVTEGQGRYRGNIAQWEVLCTVEKVK